MKIRERTLGAWSITGNAFVVRLRFTTTASTAVTDACSLVCIQMTCDQHT